MPTPDRQRTAHHRRIFRSGLLRTGLLASAIAAVSLVVGIAGFHHFVGLYALYSGLILLASAGIVLSPFMTRVLHAFHAEQDAGEGRSR